MNLIEEYQRLNGTILNLFTTGKSSGREAETTRDMMEIIWRRLSETEKTFIRRVNEGRLS